MGEDPILIAIDILWKGARMRKVDLLQGTLDMLILKTLTQRAMHGYEVARSIQQISEHVLQVEAGALYPALHRLERRRWITAEWGLSEQNRRAKYYKLTRAGRKQLESAASSWSILTEA